MENFENMMQEMEKQPDQAEKLKTQRHFLEQELEQLKAEDPGNPEIEWKTKQVEELNQMITRLEGVVDLTDEAEIEQKPETKKGRKVA